MVLFDFLQQNNSVELHINEMLKQFLLHWVRMALLDNLIFSTSTLLMKAPAIAATCYECFILG